MYDDTVPSTPSITSSGNVSSLTDNGTAIVTINFSTAMPDANYVVLGCASDDAVANRGVNVQGTPSAAQFAGSVKVTTFSPGSGQSPAVGTYVAIIR